MSNDENNTFLRERLTANAKSAEKVRSPATKPPDAMPRARPPRNTIPTPVPLVKAARSKTQVEEAEPLPEEVVDVAPLARPFADRQQLSQLHEHGKDVRNIHQIKAFLAKFEEGTGPLVPAIIRRIVSTGDDALILAQLLYWFQPALTGLRLALRFKNKAKSGRPSRIRSLRMKREFQQGG